jgi:ribonuclease D
LPEFFAELERASRVGIDTEFHAERRYFPQLYLVQVAVEHGQVWIFDPLVDDGEVLSAAAPALARVPWIVHGGQQDLRLLLPWCGSRPPWVADTQIGHALCETLYPAGFGALTARWLDLPVDKSAAVSDWSRRPLHPEQLAYAAADVLHLLPLWDRIDERLAALGRANTARKACDEAADLAHAPPPPSWRDLPGSAHLSSDQAAVADVLIRWREQQARAEDQPPRTILNDGALADLARRQPDRVELLHRDRRLPHPLIKRHGAALIAAIAAALGAPAADRPRVIGRHTPSSRLAAFLELVGEIEASRAAWAPRLILPRASCEILATEPSPTRERLREILGEWRDPLIGDAIDRAIGGREGLRFDGDDVRVFQ